MIRTASLVVAAALVTLTTGVARADHSEDNWDGVAAGLLLMGSIELAPAALIVTDLVARPQSKTYGAVELAIGGGAAALNTYIAIDFYREPNCSDCAEVTPYMLGIAAVDLAVAAHGAYLLLRDEPVQSLELGRARGTFTPTVVSDGKATAPGFGLSGTF